MDTVIFTYTGQLAAAAGTPEETVPVAVGDRLRPVLDALAGRHGPVFGDFIFGRDGRLRPTLLVIFDGVQVTGDKEAAGLDGVKTVMLMTPIAGG